MAQRILVTGANRGIGLALTRELLAQEHVVVAAARNPQQAEELTSLQGTHENLFVAQLDVTSDESVRSAVEAVRHRHETLDVLVNNAAVFPEEGNEKLAEMDLQHFRDAFETNVIGVVRMSVAFLPLLQNGEKPRIINISSGAGSISQKDDNKYYAYSVSKAALNMLTRAMAAELTPQKICVVAVSPGWVRTEMGGAGAPLSPEESARSLARTVAELSIKKSSQFLDRDGHGGDYSW